jgi:hypothetical protein
MDSTTIAQELWQRLWEDYNRRVPYAGVYQKMIEDAGGAIASDHIAFRSLRLTSQNQNLGIPYLAKIVEPLGYEAVREYHFPDSHLFARHYQHEDGLPKLFISELIVDELPEAIASAIQESVATANFDPIRSDLEATDIIPQLANTFRRPWLPPKKSIVEAVNRVTQYGAWVLIHGYSVNHFTGYVNRQNTPKYPDIETTALGLAQLGIPMKAEIEGSYSTGLRQTATQAVTEMVSVRDDASLETLQIPWTYAYYEIAERHLVEDESGKKVLFEGFLDAQARNLFEMTRLN